MNRRTLLSAASAALALPALESATPESAPSFYSTLNPKQKAAFDKLHAIVDAQANGTWVKPPDPDAELHALCATFHLEHAKGRDEANPEWEKAHDAAWGVYKQLDDIVAVTHRGCRAKAAVAVTMLAMFHENQSGGDPEALFALHMLRDWLELPV